jgi:hypothetical protein
MKKWILKAIVQKVISFLPCSHKINFLFQKHVTKGVQLSSEYFFDRLLHAKNHLNAFRKSTLRACPQSSLELGTGWYPVVPVAFFLSGVIELYSVDISILTSKERIKDTLLMFVKAAKNGDLNDYIEVIPKQYDRILALFDKIEELTFDEVLDKLDLKYIVGDAADIDMPDDSIDLVHSNNTFEHINPTSLKLMLKEFNRVVSRNGVMSHFVDMSDHFAHFDRSITIYNFLRFSDFQWSLIDNIVQPQNRLRFDDYMELYSTLGIPVSDTHFRPGNLNEVRETKLSPKFSKKDKGTVAISHSYFTSKM